MTKFHLHNFEDENSKGLQLVPIGGIIYIKSLQRTLVLLKKVAATDTVAMLLSKSDAFLDIDRTGQEFRANSKYLQGDIVTEGSGIYVNISATGSYNIPVTDSSVWATVVANNKKTTYDFTSTAKQTAFPCPSSDGTKVPRVWVEGIEIPKEEIDYANPGIVKIDHVLQNSKVKIIV